MHDSRGAPLKVGDRVLLEGELTQVSTDDSGYCNCNVKIVTPDQREKPPMDPPSLSAINTRMLTKIGAAVLLVLMLCCATCLAASPLTVPMLDMSNTIREQEHIRVAALNQALCTAAQGHADRLAYISYGPNNLLADPHSWAGDGTPAQRATAAGFRGTLKMPPDAYGWSTVGEIIAPRYTADVQSPFAGWLHSAGHRKSLLYDGFNACGFGHAVNRQGQSIFVAMYGTEEPPLHPRYRDPNRNLPSWELQAIERGETNQQIEAEWDRRYPHKPNENVGEPVQGPAESLKGGHVQGPTQAPAAQQCGPGCGQAKAYYQPRRGVRAFGSCGGGRRFAVLPRNRK